MAHTGVHESISGCICWEHSTGVVKFHQSVIELQHPYTRHFAPSFKSLMRQQSQYEVLQLTLKHIGDEQGKFCTIICTVNDVANIL